MIRLQGRSRIINYDEKILVRRDGDTRYVDGKPVSVDGVTFGIHANVQPVNGWDLMMVPEGDRLKEQYWVWTESELHLLKDHVQRNGFWFQVQQIRPWGSYFQARIVRVDVGPDKSTQKDME